MNPLFKTHTPILNQGSAADKRLELLDYFEKTFD